MNQFPGPIDTNVVPIYRFIANFRAAGSDPPVDKCARRSQMLGGKGEYSEEKHLKRGHTETGRGDEFRDCRVLHTGIRHQHPKAWVRYGLEFRMAS